MTRVLAHQKWRWAGDEIVYDPIIKAKRAVPGSRIKGYEIDAREFLGIEDNAVIRKHLHLLVEGLSPEERSLFTARTAGAFDFRAYCVQRYVSRLRYIPGERKFDHWLFPEETFAKGGGDCEDLAFCLAALLEASGISSYCIRVALGTITHHRPSSPARSWDHAWVVYLDEGGAWQLLEPLSVASSDHGEEQAQAASKEAQEGSFEYTPVFTFNRDHLWRVRSSDPRCSRSFKDYLDERSFWDGFDPSFGAAVHNSLFDEALKGMSGAQLFHVKFLSLSIDAAVQCYDPRDHFDFGYIDEGWKRIALRLKTRKLSQFACAVHAIGDFYAHTNYADYAARRKGTGAIVPYDPAKPPSQQMVRTPDYDFYKFMPIPGCHESAVKAAARWHGRLISGQWWRDYTTYPDELQTHDELMLHRTLPDHDHIAVDRATKPKNHRLYDEMEYQIQFADRRAAAVEHIRAVYQAWREAGPTTH